MERARELLAEAGFPDGFETRIFSNVDAINQTVATVIANQLAQIGILAEIVINEAVLHLDLVASAGHEIALLGYTTQSFDADLGLIPMLYSGAPLNHSNYVNPEVDRLLFAGRSAQDQDQRRAYFTRPRPSSSKRRHGAFFIRERTSSG